MSELAYAQREIDNLLNLLADARAENMRLRAALAEAGCDHCRHWFDRAEMEGK
jgi:hypothetical protein